MTGLLDSPMPQYAVVEARRTEGPSQRFVIAYPDEESLRELIAGPSIIACRFASWERAQVNIDSDVRTAAAREQTPRDRGEKYQRRVLPAKPRLGAGFTGFNLTQIGRIVRGFLRGCGRAIVIIYSRNAVSTFIRSFN